MPLIGLSILIQIACSVHCVRGGRNRSWLMVIIFLSVPGCLAYSLFEILPELAGKRSVRAARAAAIQKLDPEREVRAAREAIDMADTAANRIDLADALFDRGSYSEAIQHYDAAVAKLPIPDRALQLKLARAHLESGEPKKARQLLEDLPPSHSASEEDRGRLLLARALEDCGEHDEALAAYANIAQRLPGGEAQCRHAALLITLGRQAEAEEALAEVERALKRIDRFERNRQREMYDWALRTLVELRNR